MCSDPNCKACRLNRKGGDMAVEILERIDFTAGGGANVPVALVAFAHCVAGMMANAPAEVRDEIFESWLDKTRSLYKAYRQNNIEATRGLGPMMKRVVATANASDAETAAKNPDLAQSRVDAIKAAYPNADVHVHDMRVSAGSPEEILAKLRKIAEKLGGTVIAVDENGNTHHVGGPSLEDLQRAAGIESDGDAPLKVRLH